MPLDSVAPELQLEVESSVWSRLSEAGPEHFYESWLNVQCALLPDTRSGLLVMRSSGDATFDPVALWPDEHAEITPLAELVERVIEECCGLVTPLETSAAEDQTPILYGVAYPIKVGEELSGVVALLVATRTDRGLQGIMGQLEWGSAGLGRHIMHGQLQEQARLRERLTAANDLLACVLGESSFEAAGMKYVIELAALMACDRVSLGYVKGNRVKVRLLSHSAQFGKHMNLVRVIGDAMAEAVEQRRTLISPLPESEETCVLRAHRELSERSGSGCILTIPLYREGEYYAAMTLERPADRPFTRDDSRYCEGIAALVTAALEDKRLNDRWLVEKTWDALRSQIAHLLGPRYIGRKLAVLTLSGVVAFFSLAHHDYRLSADATLEGAEQRVVAAPFGGYIDSAHLRAGDIATRGALLATLDSRDLRLEKLKWISQHAQLKRQLQEALGSRDRARIKIVTAQIGQAEAELELVESQLTRTTLTAPFDGIIVSGDLTQRLGSAVQQGEVLFEIAPLDAYRIIMEVPERRIADVEVGQTGHLLLAALPREPFPLVVKHITPVTTVAEGGTFFRVEATLSAGSVNLRPGMEGVGKIDIDRRLLIGIWTRDLIEWLRLKLWTFWG